MQLKKKKYNVTSRHASLMLTSVSALFSERLSLQSPLLQRSQRVLQITLGQLKLRLPRQAIKKNQQKKEEKQRQETSCQG